jgi:hypothetical protein
LSLRAFLMTAAVYWVNLAGMVVFALAWALGTIYAALFSWLSPHRAGYMYRSALVWFAMFVAYVWLFIDQWVWQRGIGLGAVEIEVGRYALYIVAGTVTVASASVYVFESMSDGWGQIALAAFSFALLFIGLVSQDAMRYVAWAFAVAAMLLLLLGLWLGSKLPRRLGGRWRLYGAVGLAVAGLLGLQLSAVFTTPWFAQFTSQWVSGTVLLVFEVVAFLVLNLYCFFTAYPLPGEETRLAGRKTQ